MRRVPDWKGGVFVNGELSTPVPTSTLELLDSGPTAGAICSVLTPAIKARLKELEPGQVLLVRVNDPSACLDISSWCDLTGNPLEGTSEQGGVFSFFIRKKEST